MPLSDTFLHRLADAAARADLLDLSYTSVDTALGPMSVAVSVRGVCQVRFGALDPDDLGDHGLRVLPGSPAARDAADRIAAHTHGDAEATSALAVDWSQTGGAFARGVLQTLRREVPAGSTTTYGALARRAGFPGAARAVGSALAANPLLVVVPCHRVLPASGRLGAYAGGVERKGALLAAEGLTPRR